MSLPCGLVAAKKREIFARPLNLVSLCNLSSGSVSAVSFDILRVLCLMHESTPKGHILERQP